MTTLTRIRTNAKTEKKLAQISLSIRLHGNCGIAQLFERKTVQVFYLTKRRSKFFSAPIVQTPQPEIVLPNLSGKSLGPSYTPFISEKVGLV